MPSSQCLNMMEGKTLSLTHLRKRAIGCFFLALDWSWTGHVHWAVKHINLPMGDFVFAACTFVFLLHGSEVRCQSLSPGSLVALSISWRDCFINADL